MHFRQLPAPAALHDVVRCFWTMESPAAAVAPRLIRTVADGCPGLVFQQAGSTLFLDGARQPWARGFLYGQATQAGEIYAPGAFRALGVCFQPDALAAIFGLAADEITDSCLPLDDLTLAPGTPLTEQLLHTPTVEGQVALLAAHFRAGLARHRARVTPAVQHCVARLTASAGSVGLTDLLREVGMSERSLQRQFRQVVGIPPKLYARICRFQASLAQVRAHHYDKLSDVAFAHDYADQSHHIRAFREFAGLPPQQYRQRAHEAVEPFTTLVGG